MSSVLANAAGRLQVATDFRNTSAERTLETVESAALGPSMNVGPPDEKESFPSVLERLSTRFARVSSAEVGSEIEPWMERVARSLGLDRSVIAEFLPERGGFQVLYQWTREGFPPMPMYFADDRVPWIAAKVRKGDTVVVPSIGSLPRNASVDRVHMTGPGGSKSAVVVPFY